jgi:NitT/TauT family transport system permease protein
VEGILMGSRSLFLACQLAFATAFVFGWQWASTAGLLDPSFIGTPLGVLSRLAEWVRDGSIFQQSGATLLLIAVGLAAGTLLGSALGVLVGSSLTGREILGPFLLFFNGMPRLVLQPFFVVWLGFGFMPKVALVVAVIFVMVAVNIVAALQQVDRDLVANMRVLGAKPMNMLRHVYLPSVTLALLSTSRANIGFAFQSALVAEFVGTNSGLGFLIVKGQNTFDVDSIWAALTIVVVLSIILDQMLSLVEVRSMRWMPR